MINKKVFALTLVAASVIAAGCSSDDDDDDDPMDPITGGEVDLGDGTIDANNDGLFDEADDLNGDLVVDQRDIDDFDTDGDGVLSSTEIAEASRGDGLEELVDNTTEAVTPDDNSTDVDGDGSLGDADDVDGDGDIDQDDVDAFAMAGMSDLPDGSDYTPPEGTVLNLAELAANTPSLTNLTSQVGNCDTLVEALTDPESRLTVFAPSNEAFDAPEVTEALGAGADVCDVIAGHVLVDTVADEDSLVANVGTSATTLAGTTVEIAAGDDGSLTVGGAPVFESNNFATNGVAHIITSVILPMAEEPGDTTGEPGEGGDPGEGAPPAGDAGPVETGLLNSANNNEFASQFLSSFQGSLDDPVNTWTVFAPTNEAVAGGTLDLQNYIVTTGALDPAALAAAGSVTTNNGVAHSVSGSVDGGDLAVDGQPVTVISEGNSVVYSVDGLLN